MFNDDKKILNKWKQKFDCKEGNHDRLLRYISLK